jgi:arylformamidase
MEKFGRIYDITTLLGVESIDYPGDPPYVREVLCRIGDGGPYEMARLEMSAHCGTHLDAPAHFVRGGKTIDRYEACDFILPARVIAVEDREAVRSVELSSTEIQPGDALLFKTDNSASGRCKAGSFSEKYVHLSLEAAAYCVEKRVNLVGLDYITVERYGDDDFPVHRLLLENGILILEGINLENVPVGRYTLFCFPMKISEGEASPVRAILLAD